MRDRKIMAVYVVGTMSVVGGIVAYNNFVDDTPDGQAGGGSERRVEAGQGIFVDLALPEPRSRREEPAESRPESRATTPPAVQHTSRSAAGGSGSAPAARTASVSAAPACTQSLLGSVIGLLGALLGGGGGC